MAYVRTRWISEETALSANNMNNIEDGIEEAKAAIVAANEDIAETNDDVAEVRADIEIASSTISLYTSMGWVAPST